MTKRKIDLIAGGVELHGPTKRIGHPVVTLEWCVSPEITALMREYPEHQWAMIIVAQERLELGPDKLLGYAKRTREERVLVEGIRRIRDGRTPFTFRAPVTYDVSLFLVRSKSNTDDNIKVFWRRLRDVTRRSEDGYDMQYLENAVSDDTPNPDGFQGSDYIIPVSADNIIVSVPEGIFGKPPSEGLKNFIRANGFTVGDDECDVRGRKIWVFSLGLVLFIFAQLLVRGHFLVASALHFLFGHNPIPLWKAAFTLKAYWPSGGWGGNGLTEPMSFVHGDSGRWYLAPAIALSVLLYGLALFFGGDAWLFGVSLQALAWIFTVLAALLIFAIVVLVAALALFGVGLKQLQKKRPDKVEQMIQDVEQYALCGAERQEGPRTFHLMWEGGAKKLVCRPLAK